MKKLCIVLVVSLSPIAFTLAYDAHFETDLVKELHKEELNNTKKLCGFDLTSTFKKHLHSRTSEAEAKRKLVSSGFKFLYYGPGAPPRGKPPYRVVQAERFTSSFDFIDMYWVALTFVDDRLIEIDAYLKCAKL